MLKHFSICIALTFSLDSWLLYAQESDVTFHHALALHGQPLHSADMKHFHYVNPDAPKGGTLNASQIGSFDSFNLYGPHGKTPYGLFYTNETLLVRSWDEPLTKYGVLAEKIERPADNSWVAFHINPAARFHDDQPITAEDIVFSFHTLTESGSLFWRQFYQDVKNAEATSLYRVLFTFKHNRNRELPLLLGQLPVLASHWWKGRDFTQTSLDIPVASGPYKIHRFKPGRFVEYKRDPNYWARNHPVNIGRFNFDIIRFDFFRDSHVIIEAVKNGQMNWKTESDPRFWENKTIQSALQTGKLKKGSWRNHNPQTISLVMNSRKALLQDIRVREALASLLDIDGVITQLLHGTSERADSLFAGTEMAATGLPAPQEQTVLKQWAQQLPKRQLQQPWPPYAGLNKRGRLKYALNLLQEAGFQLENGKMLTPQGKPVSLELLLGDPSHERLMQGQARYFSDLGITLKLRTVESARYLKHIRELDFDLILHSFRHTPTPGQEQRSFWGSEGKDQPGSLNFAAVDNPVIDDLTARIPEAQSWQELVTLVQAMDRTLLWNFKVIPLIYDPDWQVIYSNKLDHPELMPRYSLERTTWWAVPD